MLISRVRPRAKIIVKSLHGVSFFSSYGTDMYHILISGQSYKASTIVIYESRVVNVSNLLVSVTVIIYGLIRLPSGIISVSVDVGILLGKYHCTADLLFDWFGFDQKSRVFFHSTQASS